MSSDGSAHDGSHLAVPGQRLENQPFDEAFDVHNAENIVTPVPSTVSAKGDAGLGSGSMDGLDDRSLSDSGGDHSHGDTPPGGYDAHLDDVDYGENSNMDDDMDPAYSGAGKPLEDDDDDEEFRQQRQSHDSAGEYGVAGDDPGSEVHWEGEYDPAEFSNLRVDEEIKDLFECISEYKPQTTDIDTKLDPFIPDYIPAVGDIDAMIKIPRADGVDLGLGLCIVDEPCAAQSDPTVLDLQLRSISKTTSIKAVEVKQIPNPQENTKALDSWITSITDLHRDKPPQNIQYSTAMPDIELLMQEWPEEVEELLKSIELPGADLDVPLGVYVSIVCALLDIPIHKSKIESLHLLFSLFVEFKNSQHFRSDEEADALKAVDPIAEAEPDVMVL